MGPAFLRANGATVHTKYYIIGCALERRSIIGRYVWYGVASLISTRDPILRGWYDICSVIPACGLTLLLLYEVLMLVQYYEAKALRRASSTPSWLLAPIFFAVL